MLKRPFYPTFTVPRAVTDSPCDYLQNKDAHSTGNEMSESGWTMYFKNSTDFDIDQQQREATNRYPTYYNPDSTFTSSEEDSSLASDASSGPQKLPLPLPVQDIFEQERQGTGSYSLLSTRKRDVHVNKREDLECVASSSSVDVNPRKNKFRKTIKNKHADLLLQDTASSSVRHSPERDLAESIVNIEQNLQQPAEILGDIEGEEVTARLETLQSLLPDGAKTRIEEVVTVAVEYINSLERSIQAVQLMLRRSEEWRLI